MFDDLGQKNNQGSQAAPKESQPSASFPGSQPQAPQSDVTKSGPSQDQPAAPEKPVFPSGEEKPEVAPAPAGKGVEDIFSKTDSEVSQPEKPDVFKPKEPQNLGAMGGQKMGDFQEEENSGKKKIIVLLAIIVGAGIILVGGFWVINEFFSKTESEPSDKKSEEAQITEGESTPAVSPPTEEIIQPTPEPEITKPLDSDQDGLSDEEEEQLGTDINSVDSDDDDLFDREEVKVYKTDPLNADTDGDGYLDGAEVKGGYNPNGEGKLYELH